MRFRHLYVDSRYRTLGSDSDFLNETIELEEGARCSVAGVSFPNVFYTVEEGVDDVWYAAIEHGGVTGGYAFKISFGNYGGSELAAEMQSKLRAVDATAQVTYANKTGRIQIVMSAGHQIKAISDEELTNPNFQAAWATYTPRRRTTSMIRSR